MVSWEVRTRDFSLNEVLCVSLGFGTDRGRVRKVNEDRYLVRELESGIMLAVADGMGGHRAGDVASSLAIKALENYSFQDYSIRELEEAVDLGNEKILEAAGKKTSLQGMGTTLTISLIVENRMLLGHVGDSRCYLFRQGSLERLTTDHSLVNDLLQENKISREESRHHPYRHVLNRALGTDHRVQVECKEYDLEPEDILLLCTDGLTNLVSEEKIADILADHSPETAVEILIEEANRRGGKDNITAVVFQFHQSFEVRQQ